METEEQAYRRLQRHADRLCSLILNSEVPDEAILREGEMLHAEAVQLFPDQHALYDLIYESRFRRLWRQFRGNL